MSIEYEGRVIRSLPEQVAKNLTDLIKIAQDLSALAAVVNAKLTGAMHYKGSVATIADLPATGNEIGDFYNVTSTGENYAWDGSEWDKIGSIVDLSGYAKKNAANTFTANNTFNAPIEVKSIYSQGEYLLVTSGSYAQTYYNIAPTTNKGQDLGIANTRMFRTVYTANISNGIRTLDLDKIAICSNLENGSGTNSLRQTDSSSDIDFDNPYYTPSVYEIGASGEDSVMLNGNSSATGKLATAIGRNTLAAGQRSFASGTKTYAGGTNSHAEGLQTAATGLNGAHAEGNATLASGNSSHAEGSNAKATGAASHAEGTSTTAGGNYSHAGGRSSETNAEGCFAHGQGLYVNQPYQVVFGKFNVVDNNALFAIGNGTSNSAKSTVFKVNNDNSITIGNTKLTETQLIALLALI